MLPDNLLGTDLQTVNKDTTQLIQASWGFFSLGAL